ncbi:GDSL-like Lipase/Acylhydrolase family protein [Nocardiopsis flavescens]|uniref:GDSL-like Lipase/Acylhydrolase family protein n=1 Tax=Nocardiopsis flavescens TaxID=758803 RepID=A0A1M6HFK0_9ACTN|nr:cellulose binding domain-containing protein [Nocardiopsis flavescens]SHJ21018.1 GDSL-like Lipase/Acylhydrolase family protein [Nocardiopsis flavescens]
MLRTLLRAALAAALVAAALAPVPAAASPTCAAEAAVTSSWGSGFTALVTVTNTGDAPVQGWTASWTHPEGQAVTSAWNAGLGADGAAYTARSAAWNGGLAPGASADFGVQGTTVGGEVEFTGLTCGFDTDGKGDAVRIMPLGDSITGSPGCWRALLWRDLADAGQEADFVGTLPGDGCGFAYDGDHEGHGGYLVTNVAAQGLLPGWLEHADPDTVLMHFGTNDVWSGVPTAGILAAYDTLLAQMRAHDPGIRLLVAQIIPMDPDRSCGTCGQGVRDLNAALPDWAAANTTPESPVTVVDQWTGFDTDEDTYDGVHPSASGDRRIADRWFAALVS